MINWLCPKPDSPSGGVFFIHKIVQVLNEIGIEAKVVQLTPFEVWWSAHSIPLDYITTVDNAPRDVDVLVIPECLHGYKDTFGAKRVMTFVQNTMWMDKSLNWDGVELLVCSAYLRNNMERNYPQAKVVGKLTPYLEEGVWQPTPKTANKVLVSARRNNYFLEVSNLLIDNGYEVVLLDGSKTQRELAEILSSCEYYVHLVHPEGFPMACLEAMRMGTLVVGTTGRGGIEFMHNRQTAVVVPDPIAGRYEKKEFAPRILEAINYLRNDANERDKIWRRAYDWSLRYDKNALIKELKAVFGE